MFRIQIGKQIELPILKGARYRVSKYFALGRRRISNAPFFMQIARASVGAVRKIISYVSFSAGPSLDTENTLLALGQDKAMHRSVAIASYPFSSFSSFFHLSKNFLIFFIYPSKEILRTRFVASFRFVLSFLFLSRQLCGWKFSIAFFAIYGSSHSLPRFWGLSVYG